MRKTILYVAVGILSTFALLTLFLSTSVIFNLFNIREKEGNYVPFIVWGNFISSLLYLMAAYGLLKLKKWSTYLLAVSVVILVVAFIGLKVYISNGGVYETKTVNAMIFRITLTTIFVLTAYLLTNKQKPIIQ